MTAYEDTRRPVGLQVAHRPQPRFESSMIAFDPVVSCIARCREPRREIISAMTFATAAARSVMTSTG